MKSKSDRKPKKATKAESDQVRDQKILAYFDDRMLNLVAQFRGLAIACGVTGEQFFKAFVDDEAQNKFFADLHAAEKVHNDSVMESPKKELGNINEFQIPKTEDSQSDNLEQPQASPTPEGAVGSGELAPAPIS